MQPTGKIIVVLSILLNVLSDYTKAQTSVETGLSLGFNRHTFSVDEPTGTLQPGIGLVETYGIPVVIKHNKWELHTGFFVNDLTQAYYFRAPDSTVFGRRSFTNGISTYKIPLHIGRSIQWTKSTTLSPHIGFAWLTNQRTGQIGMSNGSGHKRRGDHYLIRVEHTDESRAVSRFKFLAEAGLDINISVFRRLIFTFGTRYSLGIQKIEEVDVDYKINDRPYEGTMVSRGSGWNFHIGLTLPVYSRR